MPIVLSLAGALTVSKLLELAMKDAGIIGNGQTPNADDTETALDTLNQLLALWRTSKLEVYCLQKIVLPIVTNQVSYTIGPGGDLDIERPVSVDAAAWRNGTLQSDMLYRLRLLTDLAAWQNITNQTISAWPASALYEPTFPKATLYVWPQPSSGQIELTAKAYMPINLVIGDEIMLPPEYAAPIRFNLAKWICAAFGAPLRPDIASLARSTLRSLKRSNNRVQNLQMPAGTPAGQGIGRLDIIDNQYSN